MSGLFDAVGGIVGDVLANPVVELVLQLVVVYAIILWLASAFWVYRDMGTRTRDPLTPYLAATGVAVFTPVFFPLAVIAYRIARPQTTLVERRAGDLQRLVLEEDADRELCPTCNASTEPEWVRCPSCGERLAVSCESCGGRVALDWSICAWCAADVPWAHGAAAEDRPPRSGLQVPALPMPKSRTAEPAGTGAPWGARGRSRPEGTATGRRTARA